MLPPLDDVRYAASGDISIAYEVLGDGEQDIVFAPGLVPNLEMSREVPFLARWLERLSHIGRVIQFDRRGVGLSDRDLSLALPEQRMDDIRAVMDAANSARASIVTSMDGGPIALMYAATYPGRVSSLVLYETWAHNEAAETHQTDDPAQLGGFTGAIARGWGSGRALELAIGDPPDRETARRILARLERTNSTPRVALRHVMLAAHADVRAVVPSVSARSLVMWRSGIERFRSSCRWLADNLPNAESVELSGRWLHTWQVEYEDEALDAAQRFLADEGIGDAVESDRILATVLFTDIVGSTDHLARLGDRAWAELLERHNEIVRHQLHRFRGREVDTAGDGFFAIFDGPARAIECAGAIRDGLAVIGLAVRAGLHTGEVERVGGSVRGIAVHIGARVGARAGAGEILVSRTVADLVAGSGIALDDAGVHELKGVPMPWQLFRLRTTDQAPTA